MIKYELIFIFLNLVVQVQSQENNFNEWNSAERNNYETLKNLAEYISKTDLLYIPRGVLFNKYIYFDNILKDTLVERKQSRLEQFDALFKIIPKVIDSIGLENLDAKPIRFYKDHEIFKPFVKALSGMEKDVFVYYTKENPDTPLGTLLFESDSSKLASWILLKQGDSGWYFLTFNLL